MLKDKLVSYGISNQLVIYPGKQHGFTTAKMLDSYNNIIAFLQANVP